MTRSTGPFLFPLTAVLHSYLKIALRNLRRHPGYAFINVAGLAVGIACCILIVLFVRDELAYDRFHERGDRIYRVVLTRQGEDTSRQQAATPPGMGPTMVRTFPEVQQAVRFFDMGEVLAGHDERQFDGDRLFLVDPSVFDVLSFPLVAGDPATALSAPLSVVVTQEAARRYFGDEDPLGRTLRVQNDMDFTVTGVMADVLEQSHLKPDLLGSFATLSQFVSEERLQNWIWQQFTTYVLLPEGHDPALLEAKLPAFLREHADPQTTAMSFRYDARLQPLHDVHLRSAHLTFDPAEKGDVTYVYAFSAIAVFILLIACVNFMNLATARSMQRAKEVGMRKVIGATRSQLVRQFLGESTLMALAAFVLAVGLVAAVLPAFRAFTGKTLPFGPAENGLLMLALFGGSVATGLLAGSYPALYLSGFDPIGILKGGVVAGGRRTAVLRKGLVVVQFAVSIALVIGTAVVYRQLDYVRSTNLGFRKEQVAVVPLRGAMGDNVEAVKQELLRHPGVVSVAGSWGTPGSFVAGDDVRLPGSDASTGINMFVVDPDFLATYGIELAAGRGFSADRPADVADGFLLNETAARSFGWSAEAALGQVLEWNRWGGGDSLADPVKRGPVIGVVRDFHYKSMHQPIEPVVIHVYPPALGQLSVRLAPGQIAAGLGHLEATWQKWAPDWPFEYEFVDDSFDDYYRAETKLSRLVTVFAILAILVACLGLFGLASFSAERRTKEIGVRKVMGAGVPGLVALLARDFAKLVLIAFIVAAPAAYFAMSRWLEDFTYRIDLDGQLGLFVLAGLGALGAALVSVGYQSVRAALADPVDSLRYE